MKTALIIVDCLFGWNIGNCIKINRPNSGRDVIAQAQSGTGKTATFSVSILQRIDETLPHVQALVMAPTRELAMQVHYVKMKFTF